MKEPEAIELSIPQPCSENWERMSPNEKGRHCTACNKTVIDFTDWSDDAIARFLSDTKHWNACGRFLSTQLERPFVLPAQPHSKLYRWVMAAGIAAISFSAADAKAQNGMAAAKQHVPAETNPAQSRDEDGPDSLAVVGTVVDKKGEPVMNATVRLEQNGRAIAGAVTDFDGKFHLKVNSADRPTAQEYVQLIISYVGIGTMDMNLQLRANAGKTLNMGKVELVHKQLLPAMTTGVLVITRNPVKPLLEAPGKTTITGSELERMH
jgi:hypothetical protein